MIFSSPVKPWRQIQEAARAGVWRFAFDSASELDKLAEYAEGAAVCVRLGTSDLGSEVPSEGKFGVGAEQAVELLRLASTLGLEPHGIAFHVGSQMTNPAAWENATRQSAAVMRALEPYPVQLCAEPGRALVAEAGVLVASIIGTAERFGKHWLHLDVGAFNGMMETLLTQNRLVYPLADARSSVDRCLYNITGPTCDSQDTMFFRVQLSNGLLPGDQVYIYTAGAYTTCYASRFNGFGPPTTYCFP